MATQVNGIEVFGEIENLVNGWKSQITSILTTYLDQIEIYRFVRSSIMQYDCACKGQRSKPEW